MGNSMVDLSQPLSVQSGYISPTGEIRIRVLVGGKEIVVGITGLAESQDYQATTFRRATQFLGILADELRERGF